MTAGDFNGDGLTDIAAIWPNGSLRLYPGTAGGTLADNRPMRIDEKTNWNEMLQLTRYKADNSGRDGLLAVWGRRPQGRPVRVLHRHRRQAHRPEPQHVARRVLAAHDACAFAWG
ncbi:FG-GAP repeat protein [Streptomyces sp. NPDC050485]|uniref:FG-GAP repeat protein n=1 Tax=Streptomyces sp. NPDC050485 TaxID=3365617 RepID=UPI0037A3B466